jgi:hypothetical protein
MASCRQANPIRPTPQDPPMQRIVRDQARKYAFDWRDQPLLRVKPGEVFEIETWDASTGYFKTAADKAARFKSRRFRVTVTGYSAKSAQKE